MGWLPPRAGIANRWEMKDELNVVQACRVVLIVNWRTPGVGGCGRCVLPAWCASSCSRRCS